MTMAATALVLVLAQGQPLPPGHPPISGGVVPAKPLPPAAAAPLDQDQPGSGGAELPPGHPAITPGGAPPATGPGSGAPGSAGQLPAGHPSITPGAAATTSDDLIRKMDASPDLKTKPKPYEVSAAIGKLYYGRGRWADARDFFTQAEKTAGPVRALFLEQRKQVTGALPDAASAGCRLASDMAVEKVAEQARSLAAKKQHGPAAACALEALGPALDATALLGNALALMGDSKGALAAYERVLQIQPRNAEALYGHGALTFETRGDDVAALKSARTELQTAAEAAPSSPQSASARAFAQRIDQVIAAGGATKFARQQQKTRAEAKPVVVAGPMTGPMAAAPMAVGPAQPAPAPSAGGPAAPPQLSKETMEAFQKTEVTPEMQANFARLIEDGEAKLVANKYQDALDDFRQVMPYQPNNARLRAGMAWALVGLQRQPMADNVWRVAVGSDPASVDALGDRLSKAGNRESARALWTKLQASDPDYASRSGVQKKLGGSP